MRVSSRFAIAVHMLVCIAQSEHSKKVTSTFIAGSVNVNPVIVRQTLGLLKAYGLVSVDAGVGGAHIARPLRDISLLDVFLACEGDHPQLFGFHENPNPDCPVGANIHELLDSRMDAATLAFERSLAGTTLQDLVNDLNVRLQTTEKAV